MSKELTPLQSLKELEMWATNGYTACEVEKAKELIKPIETALNDAEKYKKAVEIIKEHRLDIDWFLQFVKQDTTYKTYVYCVEQSDNAFAKRFLLNEEEYELLKEILK